MTPILIGKIIDGDTGDVLMPEREFVMNEDFPRFEKDYLVMSWSIKMNYCKMYCDKEKKDEK